MFAKYDRLVKSWERLVVVTDVSMASSSESCNRRILFTWLTTTNSLSEDYTNISNISQASIITLLSPCCLDSAKQLERELL